MRGTITSPALIIVVAILIIAGVYFIAAGPKAVLAPEQTTPDGNEFQGPVTSPPAGEETSPIREITIRGDEFSFDPATTTVTAGERLRLTFANKGNAPHSFDIDELDVHSGIVNPGGSWTTDIVAPAQPVRFRTYCAVPGHVEQGMIGQLIIE